MLSVIQPSDLILSYLSTLAGIFPAIASPPAFLHPTTMLPLDIEYDDVFTQKTVDAGFKVSFSLFVPRVLSVLRH